VVLGVFVSGGGVVALERAKRRGSCGEGEECETLERIEEIEGVEQRVEVRAGAGAAGTSQCFVSSFLTERIRSARKVRSSFLR
jgi:hypothetical protein